LPFGHHDPHPKGNQGFPLSHFLTPRDHFLSKRPPDSFSVIIFFIGSFCHGKNPMGSPYSSLLANPENVKLRESSGKAEVLPLGLNFRSPNFEANKVLIICSP
jgi:hypothetical protein